MIQYTGMKDVEKLVSGGNTVWVSKSLSHRRKALLVSMELGAMFLLVFDRFAYIYRGNISSTGYWMVRISNLF